MATTTNFGWETPDDTDLVKDGALAMRTLGNAIDASLVDLKGGTTGQVLSKNSNTDMDFTWVTSDDADAIQNSIVDAKGDLIAATAADTPARLAVGNNGETLVADSSTSTGLRWQAPKTVNVVTNGNFDIWQRGTSFTSVASTGAYASDRWTFTYSGTTVNLTITQDASIPNVNSKFSCKFQQVTSNATSLTEYAARQFIEQSNILPLLGKSCVLSFWYRSNKTGSHGVRINGTYNTGGTDQVTTITVNAADTWEYKTVAVTAFSAVSAASVSATATGGFIDIGFRVGGSGAGFTSLSTNDYFQLAQVQLEVGSVATPFTRAGGNIAGELAACQRYYQRTVANSDYGRFGTGIYGSSTNGYPVVSLPVAMRVAPTSVDYSTLALWDGGAFAAATNVTLHKFNTQYVGLEVTVASGGTQYRPCVLAANNSTTAYLGFSAELQNGLRTNYRL